MQTILNKIKKTISAHSLIQPNAHILLGVSGGADSVALLHALAGCSLQVANDRRTQGVKGTLTPTHSFSLSVAHLNHGIRPEAAEDALFVEQLCHDLNIPFYTATVDVPELADAAGISLEMAARDARYKFFAEIQKQCGADAVATAHNRDDQAETLLLKLCRGAGSSGLDGIAPITKIEGAPIIRPLLDVSRREIETFLTEQNITWREDATNADTKIKRNRIRHDILPQLEKHLNPRIKEALARTASILREDNAYMEQQAKTALDQSISGILPDQPPQKKCHPKPTHDSNHSVVKSFCHNTEHKQPPQNNSLNSNNFRLNPAHPSPLKIESLRTLHPAILRRALRQWLINAKNPADKIRFDITERTIEMIFSEKGTGSITLTAETEIKREYDLLHFMKNSAPERPIPDTALTIPGKTNIQSHGITITATLRRGFERISTGQIGQIPAEAVIRWDDPTPPAITIRSWLPGDRIQPIGMKGSCKLKELFINAKISKSERANIPIFICNNEIIWIPGYRISSNRAVADQQQRSLQLNLAKT